MLDAEFLTINLAIIHLVNGFLSTLRTILFVLVIRIIEADESELTNRILLHNQRLDVTEWLEEVGNFFLGLVLRDVFDIYVVDQPSERSTVLRLKLHWNDTVTEVALKGLGGTLFLLEANETIASGAEVWVKGDLETLDLAGRLKDFCGGHRASFPCH